MQLREGAHEKHILFPVRCSLDYQASLIARVSPERGQELWEEMAGSTASGECVTAAWSSSGPVKVWKLNPTCVARPGVDKVVGYRPPESYWSMGQRGVCMRGCWQPAQRCSWVSQGTTRDLSRASGWVSTQHHKLDRQQWSSEGRLPGENCLSPSFPLNLIPGK